MKYYAGLPNREAGVIISGYRVGSQLEKANHPREAIRLRLVFLFTIEDF